MKHLKALFHDELATPDGDHTRVVDGRIHIRERSWSPSELLQAVGEPAYGEVFDNWREERRELLLEKAQETLESFDQVERFEALKQVFRKDMVMPFVGAGMSMPSGYPSWTTFIKKLCIQAGLDETDFAELIHRGEYEGAAQLIADTMGPGFDVQVEERFGLNRPLKGAVQFLPFVFPKTSVITTNFDDVVKRAYRARDDLEFESDFCGLAAQELSRELASGRRVLVLLHGTARSGRNRVLTAQEYAVAYRDASELPHVISAMFARTMLFMGCSLTVDRTLAAMRDHVGAFGHARLARHYAFLASPAEPNQRRERERCLGELNIQPIWYQANEDDESIEGFFYRLADGVIGL